METLSPDSLDEITRLLYRELRRIAAHYLRDEAPGHTLQPTALVHEAYVRLSTSENLNLENRVQFLALAAQVMRNILIDHSRRKQADKRSGGIRIDITDGFDPPAGARESSVVQLNDALESLATIDPLKAKLIELRFFGGLTGAEMAAYTGVSTSTVSREMRLAEAWLHRELSRGAA